MWKWLGWMGLLLGASAGAQDLAACGGTPGFPAWVRAGVYSGTLGPSAITLGLNPQDVGASRYFSAGRAADLPVTPFHAGDTLILQEEVRQDYGAPVTASGCLTLERGGGGLRGRWKAPGTQGALRVNLQPLNVATVPLRLPPSPGLARLRRADPLAFLKLNHAWVTSPDGRSVREPLTGLSYPRVAGASAALAAALQDRLLDHATFALDCASRLPQKADKGDGYQLGASVTRLTPRLLSVREDVDYFCGGAHPDSSTAGLILDRATGRRIALQALWPSLTPARLKALYLAAPASDPESECGDVLREMTPSFAVFLGGAGLNLMPDTLPHVVAACADTVVIPYGQLRAGANRASPYYADLYGR